VKQPTEERKKDPPTNDEMTEDLLFDEDPPKNDVKTTEATKDPSKSDKKTYRRTKKRLID
jgi:hypothetical protein